MVISGGYRPTFVKRGSMTMAPGTQYNGSELGLDDSRATFIAARRSRIYRYTSSFLAGDGLAYPGSLDG